MSGYEGENTPAHARPHRFVFYSCRQTHTRTHTRTHTLTHTPHTYAHARITHPASGPCVAYAAVLEGLCEADASVGAAEAYAVCALCRDLSGNSFSGDVEPLSNMTGLYILYYTRYV